MEKVNRRRRLADPHLSGDWQLWWYIFIYKKNRHFYAFSTRQNLCIFWLSICSFVRSFVRSFICPDMSCYHDILWAALAISMKLIGNIHQPLLMTWLNFGSQKSKSQQAVEMTKESMSTLGLGVEDHLLFPSACWMF